ncbi:hypothetical protein MF271_03620 [Deinococcus sp. KNUC1210]|uniref:hypothetical protein n=1 Tax=Deinococcus sp. KNUC1210 TaxID=2917691 RepID=UPI001EEFD3C6|nr:hypothetical protein [Deinococcus sp. KNUC1210]ULH15739.1 hypothetical protein MF271_03620 [Deinococcus sp. KNUC1210]
MKRLFPVLTLALGLSMLTPAHASALWAGADARTTGLDAHAGIALLPVPFIGTLGIEAGAASSYGGSLSINEFRVGGTLRDLNLPFTSVDAFVSGGAAFHLTQNTTTTSTYLEGGLRGPVLGPVGWRLSARGDSFAGFSAGAGLEIRF